ncbi:MAG: PQQ-dependent sugar dehydrogenase [Candidatus Promineifilaceae bacterium]
MAIPLLYYGFIYGSGFLKGKSIEITVTPPVAPARERAATASGGESQQFATPAAAIHLEPMMTDFDLPTYLTYTEDGRIFVVEKSGRIFVIQDWQRVEEPFLDIRDLVGSEGAEQGLLSIAFHPQFAENGRFFVNYTNKEGHTVVARYQVQADNPNAADLSTELILMKIGQPFEVHNGGLMKFGPDGYLYIGVGDGGTSGDFFNNAQNNNNLLGTILRVDVDFAEPYAVPADNPFVNDDSARNEIWSYGLRNPWQFSFDRLTGDLFIADVGQFTWEEIDFQEAGSSGGQNYGWEVVEGNHCFNRASCNMEGFVMPVAEYSHEEGGCAVVGGYTYRGSLFPELDGNYFFADYCSGKIWGLVQTAPGQWQKAVLVDTDELFSSFGEDLTGELYILGFTSGTVFQIQPES